MHTTPVADRIHIGIFGLRNSGKSSLINAITNQDIAIVSDIKGTTTDPVSKTMEILPLGPVVLIDTPGLDDEGELGEKRIKKTYQVLNKTDVALLVVDAKRGLSREDNAILLRIKEKDIPYLIVMNKLDTIEHSDKIVKTADKIFVSSKTKENIETLKELIAKIIVNPRMSYPIISDLVNPFDKVMLVVPIDDSAPKGRLILPQQQTIRELLEAKSITIIVKDTEIKEAFLSIGENLKMVVTDSQVFKKVAEHIPGNTFLTSFSILFARHKGILYDSVAGVSAIRNLKNKDTVLICEGCTHHRHCEDIGTVKIPRWLSEYTQKDLEYVFTSGIDFPDDLSKYKLIVHCGGCMLNEKEVKYRMKCAKDQNVPMTNYGILIAQTQGILAKSLDVFPEIKKLL